MKTCIAISFLFLFSLSLYSQESIHVYPTHWWVGMKNPKLQLLIRAKNIKTGSRVILVPYPGVKIVNVHSFENPGYLAVDLEIDKTTKPGTLSFKFMSTDKRINQLSYELKARRTGNGSEYAQGV